MKICCICSQSLYLFRFVQTCDYVKIFATNPRHLKIRAKEAILELDKGIDSTLTDETQIEFIINIAYAGVDAINGNDAIHAIDGSDHCINGSQTDSTQNKIRINRLQFTYFIK